MGFQATQRCDPSGDFMLFHFSEFNGRGPDHVRQPRYTDPQDGARKPEVEIAFEQKPIKTRFQMQNYTFQRRGAQWKVSDNQNSISST